jgi:hypothetical protein
MSSSASTAAVDADTATFMESFKQIVQEINRPPVSDEDEESEEEEEIPEPAPKKQKTSTPDELSNEEAVSIAFAALEYYVRYCDDGDIGCINGAKEYGRRVFEKAQELKAEHKGRFDAGSIVAAFEQLPR